MANLMERVLTHVGRGGSTPFANLRGSDTTATKVPVAKVLLDVDGLWRGARGGDGHPDRQTVSFWPRKMTFGLAPTTFWFFW
jgi:hypothetical protein